MVGDASFVGMSETQTSSTTNGKFNQNNATSNSGEVSAELDGIAVSSSEGNSTSEDSGASTVYNSSTKTKSYIYDVIISRTFKVDFHGFGFIDYFRSDSRLVTVNSTARITLAAPLVSNQ